LFTKRGGAREGRVLRHATPSLHWSFAAFEAGASQLF
jgi:hypothetical protein